jgi:DNA repair exonuclease SbcCD nuclease subunit
LLQSRSSYPRSLPLSFRFVHAADIHLDSPLRSLALRDSALADLIGNATRRAFIGIVDLCLDEQVDALLLSGDLYDGEQTSMKTARFLADQIRKLHEAQIKVFVIRGNHDALSRITKELTFPDSVTIFGGRAAAVPVERERGAIPVAIHGISFAQPHASESLLARFRAPIEGAVNIGLLHTSLDGSPGHDPYAPCGPAELQASGFRYWALGHIHKRATAEGTATVVMPGMPQGRDINEAGAKSVTLATVTDDGSILLEERLTSVAQFERVTVELGGIEDWREMLRALGRALGQVRDGVPSEHLVARLHLTGVTTLAWRLRRDLDLLRAEAENQAAALGKSWIDKVEVDCQAPGIMPDSAAPAEADPLEELRRLMGDVTQDDAYRAEIAAIAEELRTLLPVECRSLLGADAETFAANLAEAARDGIDDVLARLRTAAGAEAG